MNLPRFGLLAVLSLNPILAFLTSSNGPNNYVRQRPASGSACTTTSLDCDSDVFDHTLGFGLTNKRIKRRDMFLASSFYGDFEDFEKNEDEDDDDEDDDDEDDDDYIEFDDSAVANFKAKMGIEESEGTDELDEDDDDDEGEYEPTIISDDDIASVNSIDELISFATSKASEGEGSDAPSTEWSNIIDTSDMGKALSGGVVLVANPAKFCEDFAKDRPPSNALLSKFGLTLPPPPELGPDRRADLLPVLLLLDRHPLRGCHALLLNRRTGYLIGDLEQQEIDEDGNNTSPPPNLGAFMIQPLWFGGTSSGGEQSSGQGGNGLDMIHLCPAVEGAKQLTEDGLYYGGDPSQAQDAMSDPSLEKVMTGFDFKFFVQSTRWLPMQLEKEIRDGSWFVSSVSKEVLFKSRDRLGAKRAKPLWTEVMELMGGEYKEIRDNLYGEKE